MSERIRITNTGRIFIHRSLIVAVQQEIDETLEEDPELYPIDAATLILLEIHGYSWDFEKGQLQDADPLYERQ